MKRRNLLQAGVSLAVAPLAGCAPAPPPPPALPRPLPSLPEAHSDFVSTIGPAPPSSPPAPPPPTAEAAPPAPPPKAPFERVVARVGTNHGHVFQVTLADVNAGVAKTYDLTGTAGHGHAVTLEPDVLARLRAGEIVRMPSTRVGHLHRLLVKLAPAVDPPEAANVCETKIGGKDDHELIVTAADMAAKADKTYDIQGVAAHTHAVRITADDFERLGRGERVTLSSGAASPGEDHGHVLYVRYAGHDGGSAPKPPGAAKAGGG